MPRQCGMTTPHALGSLWRFSSTRQAASAALLCGRTSWSAPGLCSSQTLSATTMSSTRQACRLLRGIKAAVLSADVAPKLSDTVHIVSGTSR